MTAEEMQQPLRDVPESWPVHASEEVWSGGAPFTVRRDVISAPGLPDEEFGRLVLEHPGAVIVLAVDADDNAFVLQQYRHPPQMRFVELPAGLLDVAHEDPVVAAQRELREEALLVAGRWTHLLTTYPSPGLSSERMEIYLAEELEPAPDRGDFELAHEEADMTTAWVPVDHLLDGVLGGRFTDGPLALAVMTYRFRRAG